MNTLSNSRIERALQTGMDLYQQGEPQKAEAVYSDILTESPDNLRAIHLLGIIALETHRTERAVGLFRKAIEINGEVSAFHNNLGHALQDLEQFEKAIESYDNAIKLDPNRVSAYYNRGAALRTLGRLDEALSSYEKVLALDPRDAEAYNERGRILEKLNRLEEAIASYDAALSLKADFAEIYSNRGNALTKLGNFDGALESFDRAIELKPDYAEAYSNRGNTLNAMRRFEESLQSYDRAIRLKPDYAEAYSNRGVALAELKRFEEALQSYSRAIQIKPNIDYLRSNFLHTKMRICDWSNYELSVAELISQISHKDKLEVPFYVVPLLVSPGLQRVVSERWINAKYPSNDTSNTISRLPTHQKPRIGYFSADFCNHATAFLMAELFERHDRSKFEMIAFSFGPDTGDDMRRRLKAAFDKFIDVKNMSDLDIALLARSLEIDIGVDLKGFTQDARTNIFAMRVAPIQVAYLGYPGTIGANYIDYLIADPTLIPFSHRQYYTEKIVYLPNTYQPNDRTRKMSETAFTRVDVGLPQEGFVFCSFNNNYKITPDVFDNWMRILTHADASVLWLLKDNEIAARNLRKEASVRGIDPDRLIFAPRMALSDHLARQKLADLFLDTLPCNAHTTASDALWAGLPVLTQIGETFAGRVAASLLTAIGLPELITNTSEEYVELALELAADPVKLASIRRKLADNRLAAPLFDTDLYTRHIEAAYTTMYERYRADLPPDHIHVRQ